MEGCLPGRLGGCENQSNGSLPPTSIGSDLNPPLLNSIISYDSSSKPTQLNQSVPRQLSSSTRVDDSVKLDNSDSPDLPDSPVSDSPLNCHVTRVQVQTNLQLPDYSPLPELSFVWGSRNSTSVCSDLETAYKEIVHWKRNLFSLPSGNVDVSFIKELARLFRAYGDAGGLEGIAMKAIPVICALLLQKPHPKSKHQDHKSYLSRRLGVWKDGDINSLLEEGRSIQSKLKLTRRNKGPRDIMRSFSNLKDALTDSDQAGLLSLSDSVPSPSGGMHSVLDALKSKHPPAQPIHGDAVGDSPNEAWDIFPSFFDPIDGARIRSAAINTRGGRRPIRN